MEGWFGFPTILLSLLFGLIVGFLFLSLYNNNSDDLFAVFGLFLLSGKFIRNFIGNFISFFLEILSLTIDHYYWPLGPSIIYIINQAAL